MSYELRVSSFLVPHSSSLVASLLEVNDGIAFLDRWRISRALPHSHY